jgi:hypothetical protein
MINQAAIAPTMACMSLKRMCNTATRFRSLHENWALFTTLRDSRAMEGCGPVLMTTNKRRLDETAGKD